MHFVPASITVQLKDGTPVLLREVSEADRERALDAFDRMSVGDVYLRFWNHINELDENLLTRLTRTDQVNHLGWCALNPDDLDEPGYGAGSLWRSEHDSTVGELSLTVLPTYQGRGLGTVLLAMMWVLARYLGMQTLRNNVLSSNLRVVLWLKSLGGIAKDDRSHTVIDFDLTRPLDVVSPQQAKLARWIDFFDQQFGAEI